MKKVMIAFVFLVLSAPYLAKNEMPWDFLDEKPFKIIEVQTTSSKTELVRLYKGGLYEHLLYLHTNSEADKLERALGVYEIDGLKITFHKPNKGQVTGKFKPQTYFYNGKLYSRLLDIKLFKKKELYPTSAKSDYKKPFFMSLKNDVIIKHNETCQQLELKKVVDYLVRDSKSEEEKALRLVQFIVASIAYDYEGLRSRKYANPQNNSLQILAGQKRVAVCAGYAYVFNELCALAGLTCKEVSGYTKQNFHDLNRLGGLHAWNIVEINGKPRLYDVTWADGGSTMQSKWIDVHPEVMIGSHFPSRKEDQLLETPISEADFTKSAVLTPIGGNAKPIKIPIPALQFISNELILKLPGSQQVKVYILPEHFSGYDYSGADNKFKWSDMKPIGKSCKSAEGTCYSIPLTQKFNPLVIEVNNLQVRTVVFNGTREDMMQYHLDAADSKNASALVRGILGALFLKNDAKLKQMLTGSGQLALFDKKGKLSLNPKISDIVANWQGELSVLNIVEHRNMLPSYKESVVYKTTMHIDVPNKLRFQLKKNEGRYEIDAIELI
jgi:hypothetical protein